MSDEVSAQREYYTQTAERYDEAHIEEQEHQFAMCWLSALIGYDGHKSLLDIGSGTGRTLIDLKDNHDLRAVGIEPVEALRKKGHAKGLSADELIDGDVLALPFDDDSFDIVTSFAVLHHIKDHKKAVSEMSRVARQAVFISDANNFGQGRAPVRAVKQLLRSLRLWRALDWLRTGGKGFHQSEGDGIFYSYSLIDDLPVLREKFPLIHHMNTKKSGPNLYRTAPHLAVYARR